MSDEFWLYDFSILFNKNKIGDFLPQANMSDKQKLNAFSRFVIYLSLILFVLTFDLKYLIYGILTLFIVAIYYKNKEKPGVVKKNKIIEKPEPKAKIVPDKRYLITPTVKKNKKLFQDASSNLGDFNLSRVNIPRCQNMEHQQKEFAQWLYSKSA